MDKLIRLKNLVNNYSKDLKTANLKLKDKKIEGKIEGLQDVLVFIEEINKS